MDDDFEAYLVQEFRTPTDRPGRWEMARAVENQLRRRAAIRSAALSAATLVGVGLAAAVMAAVGAFGPMDEFAREAAAQAAVMAGRPLALTILGLLLLGVTVGGMATRDL